MTNTAAYLIQVFTHAFNSTHTLSTYTGILTFFFSSRGGK